MHDFLLQSPLLFCPRLIIKKVIFLIHTKIKLMLIIKSKIKKV